VRLPRLRLPRTARVPVAALGCLVLFMMLSVETASRASYPQSQTWDNESPAPRRYAQAYTLWDVAPGDQVDLRVQLRETYSAALPHLRVLVVEGGEGDAIQAGGSAQHVHLDVRFEDVARRDKRSFSSDYLAFEKRFDRPGIYAGKPAGRLHDALDVVVLADRPAWMGDAEWKRVEGFAAQASVTVYVAHEPWVTIQYVWYAGMAASAAVAIVGFVGFARRRPEDAAEAPGGPLADLVGLHGKALGFLRSLRATMAACGAILAVGGLAGLVAVNIGFGLGGPTPGYDPIDGPDVGPFTNLWHDLLMALGFLTYALALGVWFVQYRRIAREHRRWTSTPSPLDE
jgi:hypothetical protein